MPPHQRTLPGSSSGCSCLTLLLCLSVLLAAPLHAQAQTQAPQAQTQAQAPQAQDPTAAKAQLQELQASIQALQDSLNSYKGKRARLVKRLKETELELGELSQRRAAVNDTLRDSRRELQALETRQTELEALRDSRKAAINQAIRDAYKYSQDSRVKLLLNQQDPAQFERLLEYYERVNTAMYDRLQAYQRTLDEIEANRAERVLVHERMQAEEQALARAERAQQKKQAERRDTLAAIAEDIRSRAAKLQQEEQLQGDLQSFLQEVQRQVDDLALPADGKAFTGRKGAMTWPVAGELLNQFGDSKPDSQFKWQGISFGSEEGKEVHSVHAGRVVYADWLQQMGLLIMVDHGENYMSLYAHNAALLKNVGDRVQANEVIARVGNSGGQLSNALYFEIRHKGKPVDPADWCE